MTAVPFRIRPAVPADGPGIARVRVTTWRAAYRGIVSQEYLDQLDIAAESARRTESLAHIDPARCVFVAETLPPPETRLQDGESAPGLLRVVGFSMGGPIREEDPEHTSELYAIYVLPEYQGSGLGRGLFRAVQDWLARQGHKRMILYVLRDNAPSRRFYEAQGGRLVREHTIEIGGQVLDEVGYGYELPFISDPPAK